MLEQPESEPSGTQIEPPCYRCLYEKPISDKDCAPETCDMIDAWLTDEHFQWKTYLFKWTLNIELKNAELSKPSLKF